MAGYLGQSQPVAAGGNSVETEDIVDGAVTADKLAPGAAVPDQDTHGGKFLTTDGDDASWATVDLSSKLDKAGGAITGAITTTSTFDGRDVGTDGTKLDTIATSANNYSHPTGAGNEHLPSSVSQTEAGYLDGVTSAIQTQINSKTTESYVDTSISNLVSSSPATLDTLNELAAALGDDANFSTTVTNSIAEKAPSASPALTGTPTAPTAVTTTNTTQVASTAFVQQEIAAIPEGMSAPLFDLGFSTF